MNVKEYAKLLQQSGFDQSKSNELIDGFTNGFDLGYRGPRKVKLQANNLKLHVGSKIELWNKVMHEVKEKQFAGGFKVCPFDYFIQSPLGNCRIIKKFYYL